MYVKVTTPEEFVVAVFRVVPVVPSKKVIVLPAIADKSVAVSFTCWPGVIPPDGIAEPSVLVMAKVIDCGVVFWLTKDEEPNAAIQTVELLEMAQLPDEGVIKAILLSDASITPSPEKFASIVCVPVNCGTYV